VRAYIKNVKQGLPKRDLLSQDESCFLAVKLLVQSATLCCCPLILSHNFAGHRKIENLQLGSANRLEACLAIDLVVAWRIHHLTKLGRETPDVPCSVYFGEEQWKTLNAFVTKNPLPPEEPPTLREAIRMVAALGGFLGRKGDGEPGTQALWLGLQ